MKFGKLLRNNTFLINSSVCVVVLLVMCYFSLNMPVKSTYSTDGQPLVGSWIWNDEIDLEEMGIVYYNINYILDFKDDSDNSYEYITIESLGGFKKDISIHYDSDLVAYTDSGKLSFEDSESRIMHFDKSNTNVDYQFVMWIMMNATPYNRCYYNSSTNTYEWTNLFYNGVLQSEISTQESCEAKNRSSVIITYNDDGKIDKVSVKLGDSVSLPNATKSGYSFDGWYTAPTGGVKKGTFGESFTPEGNVTLYAQFTPYVIDVDFGIYELEENYVILPVGTTKNNFEKQIISNVSGGEYIYSKDGKVVNDLSTLSTGLGFKIVFPDGRENAYVLVVLGDVSGNGIIDTMDYMKVYAEIKSHILNDAEKKAADYHSDGIVSTMDYMEIYNYLKGVTE